MPEEKPADFRVVLRDFLGHLRDLDILGPCDLCRFPAVEESTEGTAWLCELHAEDQKDEPEYPEIKDEEDG